MRNLNEVTDNDNVSKDITPEDYINSFQTLKYLEFKAMGGWPGLVTSSVLFGFKWFVVGFMASLGASLMNWMKWF